MLLILALLITCTVGGPTLPNVINDNMVLQWTGSAVWGKGTGSQVTVEVLNEETSESVFFGEALISPAGTFYLDIPEIKYSGTKTYSIVFEDTTGTTTIGNVMFGDVFHCGGQSNMEYSIGWDTNGASAKSYLRSTTNIRFFQGQRPSTLTTLAFNMPSRGDDWMDGTNSQAFDDKGGTGWPSAVCVWMAIEISKVYETQLPIGLMITARGGSSLGQLMSTEAVNDAKSVTGTCGGISEVAALGVSAHNPTGEYYGPLIHPIIQMKFRAMLFYQGEADADYSTKYPCAINAFIKDIRTKQNHESLPFITFQLTGWASYVDAVYPMRDAQLKATLSANTHYVVTIDNGYRSNIHSIFKEQPGRRAAMHILKHVYGEDVDTIGPEFSSAVPADHNGVQKLLVTFKPGSAKSLTFVDGTDCTKCCAGTTNIAITDGTTWYNVPSAAITLDDTEMWIDVDGGVTGLSLSSYGGIRIMYAKFVDCALSSHFECLAGYVPALPGEFRS